MINFDKETGAPLPEEDGTLILLGHTFRPTTPTDRYMTALPEESWMCETPNCTLWFSRDPDEPETGEWFVLEQQYNNPNDPSQYFELWRNWKLPGDWGTNDI